MSTPRRCSHHDSKTVAFARQLAAAGWTVHQIQQMLAKNGTAVAWATVKAWVDDDYRQRRNRITGVDKRIGNDRSGEYLRRTLRRLHGRGLTEDALCVIAEEYHGVTLDLDRVRTFLLPEETPVIA